MIRLDTADGLPLIVNVDDGRSILVQTDYDYPGVASTFGWSLPALVLPDGTLCPSDHDGTDGSIQCPGCGQPASYFIEAAGAYLRDEVGATAQDSGYFTVT